MKEKRIITLSNGGKYLLLHDMGELEGFEGRKFFFAIGVTPDYDLDREDVIFLSTYQLNGKDMVQRVSESSKEYQTLSLLEVVSTAMENIPNYKAQLEEELEKLRKQGEK